VNNAGRTLESRTHQVEAVYDPPRHSQDCIERRIAAQTMNQAKELTRRLQPDPHV
jgi:hypothetical protein